MKVKNIVFSGFAAAILMGVAADASAEINAEATHVVTKGYIDELTNTASADAGTYVTGVKQVAGKVDDVITTGFDTDIPDTNPSNTTAPTTKAVVDYVTEANTVYTSADTYINVDNTNDKIGLTNITSEVSGITGTSTALTTGKAVFDYVTANDTTYTAGSHINIDANNAIAVKDVTENGTDIGTGDTGLTTGNAVYEYVTGVVNDIEYEGDTYINVNNTADEIKLTNFTNDAGGIVNESTALTTANAVYDYVTQLTGGVLPDGCNGENDNCALVKLGGSLQWVNLTTPVEDQDQTTGG